MANCLKYAGYTFRFEYGMGSHNLSHAGSLFADTLNWMFNDNSPVGSASGSGCCSRGYGCVPACGGEA